MQMQPISLPDGSTLSPQGMDKNGIIRYQDKAVPAASADSLTVSIGHSTSPSDKTKSRGTTKVIVSVFNSAMVDGVIRPVPSLYIFESRVSDYIDETAREQNFSLALAAVDDPAIGAALSRQESIY